MKKIKLILRSLLVTMLLTVPNNGAAHANEITVTSYEVESIEGVSIEEYLEKYCNLSEEAWVIPEGHATEVERPQITTCSNSSDWSEYGSRYFYNQLTDAEKGVYDAYYSHLNYLLAGNQDYVNYDFDKQAGGEYYAISEYQISSARAMEIAWVVYYDNPQFYFQMNSVLVMKSSSGIAMGIVPIVYEAYTDGSYREKATETIQNVLEDWHDIAMNEQGLISKERKVHDIIVDYTVYNLGAEENQSMSSLILNKETVCAGYAKTFQALANSLGIDTLYVVSDIHAWNLVQLYGNWYVVDVTWDDTYSNTSTPYKYFNISDSKLALYDSSSSGAIKNSHVYKGDAISDMYPECINDTVIEYEVAETINPDESITETIVIEGVTTSTTKYTTGEIITSTMDKKGDVSYEVTGVKPEGSTVKIYLNETLSTGHVVEVLPEEKVLKMCYPEDGYMMVEFTEDTQFNIVDKTSVMSDVIKGQWYYEAAQFAAARGLLTANSQGLFNPNLNMSRAMVWTVLFRFDNIETSAGGLWYQESMEWAIANGISNGASPSGNVTREQFPTLVKNFAGEEYFDTGSYLNFGDGQYVDTWAIVAMCWAVDKGIITGRTGNLIAPRENVMRSEAATMFMRYIKMELVN